PIYLLQNRCPTAARRDVTILECSKAEHADTASALLRRGLSPRTPWSSSPAGCFCRVGCCVGRVCDSLLHATAAYVCLLGGCLLC
uniref:Uncharacterized protein n=1 Tax=Aegilops tauschii subsp. strangulata TaxID=200361 RepID=A0A453EXM6_AEGTS